MMKSNFIKKIVEMEELISSFCGGIKSVSKNSKKGDKFKLREPFRTT